MKTFMIFALALTSVGALAGDRNVEIECTLTPSQSATVAKVQLYSATDEIKIQYRDGSRETVKPVDAQNSGTFGDEDFSSDLSDTNGQVFAPDTAVGPIYIQFGCYITPSIFFKRCVSQGSGEPARYAGVRMNLQGKVIGFFDHNICSRTDHSSR